MIIDLCEDSDAREAAWFGGASERVGAPLGGEASAALQGVDKKLRDVQATRTTRQETTRSAAILLSGEAGGAAAPRSRGLAGPSWAAA